MLIHVRTQHKWDTHLPQLQQFVGSDLPLWKNSQTDCASGVSTSANARCPSDVVGEGTGRGAMELCSLAACRTMVSHHPLLYKLATLHSVSGF